MIKRLRTHAHEVMNLGKPADFHRLYDRSGVKDFQEALKLSPTDIKYAQFPPILHRDTVVKPINVFLNETLPLVGHLLWIKTLFLTHL